MRARVLLFVILASAVARAQVEAAATGTTEMQTPPPVSGIPYPTQVANETRANYLRGGLNYSTAYASNMYAGPGSTSIAETTFSVLPTISIDETATRRHLVMMYSPGYTFYQPSSQLNQVDNTATGEYDLRLAPHTNLRLSEHFDESSNPFNGAVSGSLDFSTPGAIPPFAKRLTNSANAGLTMQTGRNTMFGGSGLSTVLHYPNPSQTPGLYDSNSRGGSVFYNHRISDTQYFGVSYQYQDSLTSPTSGTDTTQTHTPSGFYTFYPKKRLSLSVSAGPQHYQVSEPSLPVTSQWGPFVSPSMGWHGRRTNFAASYSQAVTGGGGLLGAFHTKYANATASWQVSRTWTASAAGNYSLIKSVSEFSPGTGQNGNTVTGSATLNHSIGDRLSLEFNYTHLRQNYGGIAAIAPNPNSDRGTVSINWHFARPLGR
jgi:hypothetical protein